MHWQDYNEWEPLDLCDWFDTEPLSRIEWSALQDSIEDDGPADDRPYRCLYNRSAPNTEFDDSEFEKTYLRPKEDPGRKKREHMLRRIKKLSKILELNRSKREQEEG